MMDFVLRMMNFVLKVMNHLLMMMDFLVRMGKAYNAGEFLQVLRVRCCMLCIYMPAIDRSLE